jgi:hypothetical protein
MQDATNADGGDPNWRERTVAAVAAFLRAIRDDADGAHFSFKVGPAEGELWTGQLYELAEAIEREIAP